MLDYFKQCFESDLREWVWEFLKKRDIATKEEVNLIHERINAISQQIEELIGELQKKRETPTKTAMIREESVTPAVAMVNSDTPVSAELERKELIAQILTLIGKNPEGLSAKEIAAEIGGIHFNQVTWHLRGYIERQEVIKDGKKYRLSSK
jgi:hypothetical protein